jgi:hypothetical protein
MLTSPLASAVAYLAEKTAAMSDADMGQPFAWKWHDSEGARFALIGTYQELHEIALDITTRRHANGNLPTEAQRALAIHHAAFRDLQALFLGVTEDLYSRDPKVGEWSLRYVLSHMIGAERTFFTLVHYGLRRVRGESELPLEMTKGDVDRITGSYADFEAIMEQGPLTEMLAFATALHERSLTEFAGITDAELQQGTLFWEGEPLSIRHRLLRFAAHNRQHTIQAEKTLEWLGATPNEAKRLLRQVYIALAEVESAMLGATEAEADILAQERVADTIRVRADEVADLIEQCHALVTAVQARDKTKVEVLIATHERLSETMTESGVSALMLALYYGGREVADVLAAKKPWLTLQEAAALGNVEKINDCLTEWSDWVKEVTPDGYTALQLACFFGNEEAAKILAKAGSDLNAISQNSMATTPLHAATAGNHTEIARYLVEQGAELHHTQNGGFTVLHSAAQNGNPELVALFLEKGVDQNAKSNDGRTARDFAEESGESSVLALL